MSDYILDYLYNSEFKIQLFSAIKKPPAKLEMPSVCEIENATILPGMPDPKHIVPWGMGGVLDSNNNFVEESGVVRAFGGKYTYSPEEVVELDEEVIHINIIPKHWGHFLVDTVSRLWYLLENDDCRRITYCGWKLDEDGIGGNYLCFFEKLGIPRERLIYVKSPLRVKKAIIPDRTFEYSGKYHEKYRNTVQALIWNICNEESNINRDYPERVYLTRTQLKKAKYYDTGEKEVEEAFRRNGFTIIASEKLSLTEQVMIFQNAKIVASLSGTLPHNIIFTSDKTELIILNRTAAVLPPQIGFNNLFDRKITYVDAFNQSVIKNSVAHGDGPFWVECNENVARWFKDNGFSFHDRLSYLPMVWVRNYVVYNGLKIARKLYGVVRK